MPLLEDAGVLDVDIDVGALCGGEPRVPRFNGLNALMAAILEEAIRNYCDGNDFMRADVEVWMARRQQTWPFSFAAVCEHLGLQPDAVRAALRRRVPAAARRPRRINVRATRRLR